ncbi:TlpA disulfide reductase family protein [Chryseobacterium sp. ERMR1:04]|uniref:TlpA family protein disulfide reductase n=1 Tax=Chryseobacterium sp. ERMR1:04 TaxID=1705393 RepID=UPI0006C88BE5|nr:TlpA disulfide reductase family protein [Chryseobacterium sp. ERMR1:04]KPH14675.1 thioredoxin [Chryseobacterium sp. ERMR1:04]
MDKFKQWFKKNWSTAILGVLFVVLLVSPNAKAWLMRQAISTGLFNAKIEEKTSGKQQGENKDSPSVSLSVRDEKGRIISTSELKGKVVFINFWASWCPPCRAEFPSIQQFYTKYQSNADVVFLTINLDNETADGKAYLEKEKFTVPFLVPNDNIPSEYFNGSLPTTVVLDKKGKIRLRHSGMADYSKDSFYQEIDQLLKE